VINFAKEGADLPSFQITGCRAHTSVLIGGAKGIQGLGSGLCGGIAPKAARTTSPQRGNKASYPIAFICTTIPEFHSTLTPARSLSQARPVYYNHLND